MTREAIHAMLQGIHDRLEARKELAIAKVTRKPVGVEERFRFIVECDDGGRATQLPSSFSKISRI